MTGNGDSGVVVRDLSFAGFSASNVTGNLSGTDVVCQPQFPATQGRPDRYRRRNHQLRRALEDGAAPLADYSPRVRKFTSSQADHALWRVCHSQSFWGGKTAIT